MKIENGIICFTFDDRHFEDWIKAIPIFKKYNAHASFFIYGDIDEEALSAATILKNEGHTVGLHTLNHSDAPEFFSEYGGDDYYKKEIFPCKQKLGECGIEIKSFAYPNNKRNAATDKFLSKYFNRFRAGVSSDCDIRVNEISEHTVLGGHGIGEFYCTKEENILDKIRTAANENLCITFFSHDISESPSFIGMSSELLEKALSLANKLGVKALGFDELP